MIVSIEFGTCQAVRAVDLGCNARLPFHGRVMLDPIVRLRIDSGVEGFGWSSLTCKEEARALLGKKVGDLISRECGVVEEGRKVEAALWDLLGKICGVPVFRLLGGDSGATVYFTHLYFSDLGVKDDADACKLLAEEAKSGVAQGHTAFKMKVGRGAMHMPLLEGTERDIKIIKAVRAVVGPEAVLMIDANNGYNLNIAKWVLTETKECKLFWLEEAFHEDPVLYKALKGSFTSVVL
jgi:L-rhamnonate dehydratase